MFPFSASKYVLTGRFVSNKKVSVKATRALTHVSRNDLQECFQKHHECGEKCVTAQGNHFEENICIQM
jgi:hypothetical protein